MSVIERVGHKINFEKEFFLGGTELTATAAELNALDGITSSVTELNKLTGATVTAAELNRLAGLAGSPIFAAEVTFTETAGAGTYTGTVSVPAGGTLIDIIINGVALWDNAGTAVLTAGDAGAAAGYYTGVNLKATDLLAGESLSFALAGGKAGTYIANSQVSPRYSATARDINIVITTSSTGGSTGRTRATVIWSKPVATDITAATKA